MLLTHPNPVAIWDDLPEKLVQEAIFKKLDPTMWVREYPVGVGYLDLLGTQYAIEIKKATGSNPAYNTLGQILYYQAGLLREGLVRQPVILLYGCSFDRYLDPIITTLRRKMEIRLWVVISLADGLIADVDSEGLFRL